MKRSHGVRTWLGLPVLALTLLLTGGCEALRPKATPQVSFYTLDRPLSETRLSASGVSPAPRNAPTLIVNTPHAAAGFDSAHIVYLRQPHRLEYFAYSEWADTPARMLGPLIVDAIESGGAFHAVVTGPSAASGELRLDTEILRLQHDFSVRPSRVRFTLRATLTDEATHRVLVSREFDHSVEAASEDPYGGVVAANRAVQIVLGMLAGFCAEVAGAQSARAG